eukprot:6490392-Amphidinium_carterae.2
MTGVLACYCRFGVHVIIRRWGSVLKSWLAQPRLEGALVLGDEDTEHGWEARASAFLNDPHRKAKSAVPERTASWQFLQSLDNMLRIGACGNMSKFVTQEYIHDRLQA